MKILPFLLFASSLIIEIKAIIGYDCGQKFTNFTTYSLVDIGECELPSPINNETKVKATVLQLNDFSTTLVRYCKVEIVRSIFHCGVLNHYFSVRNSQAEYLKEITKEQCNKMHTEREIKFFDNRIPDLIMNGSKTHTLTMAGWVGPTGSCESKAQYSDPFGDYYDVVVQGYIKIRLEERWNTIDLNNNKMRLDHGTTCTFSDGHCIDSSLGYAFWDTIPLQACQGEKFTQIYSGPISKVIKRNSQNRPLYVLESDQLSFAFKDKGELVLCSFKLIKTEHPKLFILIDELQDQFDSRKVQLTQNLDIFAYVNSKFLYVERHTRKEMLQLYQDVLLQQCELERKVIANALSLATISPDLLAYTLMGGPGYMSLLAGEVVHILKCIPVEVTPRELDECYQELPVMKRDKQMFLSPRTHILKEFGTRTVCDRNLPVIYRFGATWIKIMPTLTSQEQPQIIKPQTELNWKYQDPADLATTGLYTYSDLENLKTFIMFPNEKTAVLNQLAMSAAGKGSLSDGVSLHSLLDENTLKHIAENTWNNIWGKFVAFGSASAGFITILMIFRLIKFAIDTIIHGYALHSIYGWSIHLLGAVWNSITNLLLHLSRKPKETASKRNLEKSTPSAPPSSPESPTITNLKNHLKETTVLNIRENNLYPIIEEPTITSLNLNDIRRIENV